MIPKTVQLQVGNGINNKARSESLPPDFVRSAINVDFDNSGRARLRPGRTAGYTGTGIHSYWERTPTEDRYFVEEGVLKQLHLDNTATIVKAGVGNENISYTAVAGRIYYSNGVFSGCIINNNHYPWGLTRPPFQPKAEARPSGDMHEGEYQVAITWLRNITGAGREESGAINASRTVVVAGGGLKLSNFPVPPSDITHVAVYVTPVNGKDLSLYGEYPVSNASEIFVDRHISKKIPLITQFSNKPPHAFPIIEAHYGRIYGAFVNYVFFSDDRNYGLFNPNSYWAFPEYVTGLISVPGMMYVGTKDKVYRVTNIDGEGFPVLTVVKEYGMVRMLNTTYDPDHEIAYFLSSKGVCAATSEGITEITEKNYAIDHYKNVVLSVVEQDGIKKLIVIAQGIERTTNLKASV